MGYNPIGNIASPFVSTGDYILDSDLSPTTSYTIFKDNRGYNPLGYIASPVSGTGAAIIDYGSSSTWVSGTTYTDWDSPKILYITGGTVTAIVVDSQTLYTSATTCTIILQLGDTFSVTFSSAPTIKVFGQ